MQSILIICEPLHLALKAPQHYLNGHFGWWWHLLTQSLKHKQCFLAIETGRLKQSFINFRTYPKTSSCLTSAESAKCFGHLFPGIDRIFGLLPEKQRTIECMKKDTVKKKTKTTQQNKHPQQAFMSLILCSLCCLSSPFCLSDEFVLGLY